MPRGVYHVLTATLFLHPVEPWVEHRYPVLSLQLLTQQHWSLVWLPSWVVLARSGEGCAVVGTPPALLVFPLSLSFLQLHLFVPLLHQHGLELDPSRVARIIGISTSVLAGGVELIM